MILVFLLLFPFTAAADPPHPLTDQTLDNLTAFARLLALVRFFHPSDAVAKADWNRVAVAGVSAIEDAPDPQSLARGLEDFFRPLAPTLRVRSQGVRAEIPTELRPPAGKDARIVIWRHLGGTFDGDPKPYASQRIDNRTPTGYGTLAQDVAPEALRGKKVRLRAWVRAEVAAGARAQLGLRVDRAGGKPGFFDNMADRPIRDPAWRMYEIEGEVAPDAVRIVVLLVLTGAGKVWLDDVSLEAAEGGIRAPLANAALDAGLPDLQPPGWTFPYESIREGYHLVSRRGEPCRRGGCAEIFSDEIASPRFSRPEEVLEADLGGGVVAALPIALYADERGTLPHPAPGAPAPAWTSVDATADNRAARLAAVILAWGIFQHLHPELQPEDPAWSGALRSALAEIAVAPDREAFLRAAARFLVPLRDCRAFFSGPRSERLPQVLPLAWEWIEDRLVITGAPEEAKGVRVGDLVMALDGRPAADRVAEEEALVSAATPESRRWRAVENLLYGPSGSAVTLRLERAGGAPFDVSVSRIPWSENLPAGTPLAAVDEPRPGVVYVDLGRVTEEGFSNLLPRLASARGVVFDIRRGSNLPVTLLSYLTDRTITSPRWQTPMVTTPDHRGVLWVTTAAAYDPRTPRLTGRIAFLSDGRDNFSELYLTIVEAYGLGEIVGARSQGCSGMINRSHLPGGYRVMWTGRRTLKRDGTNLHGVRVEPTVPAARTLQGIAAGRDEIVERAVEILSRNLSQLEPDPMGYRGRQE